MGNACKIITIKQAQVITSLTISAIKKQCSAILSNSKLSQPRSRTHTSFTKQLNLGMLSQSYSTVTLVTKVIVVKRVTLESHGLLPELSKYIASPVRVGVADIQALQWTCLRLACKRQLQYKLE